MKLSGMHKELLRKAVHLVFVLSFVYAPYILTPQEIIQTALILGVSFLVVEVLGLTRRINVERASLGGFFLPLGVAIQAFLFLPDLYEAYAFGLLVAGFADTAAALVGRYFGRTQFTVFGYTKSMEGFLAFFVVTAGLIFYFIPDVNLMRLVQIATLLASIELISPYGIDNLTLPATAGAMFLMMV